MNENPFEFYKFNGVEIVRVKDHVLDFEKHTHTSDFTCSVITKGEAVFTCEDRTVTINENKCFTVLPDCPHSLTSIKPVSMISLCISKNLLNTHKSNPAGYKEMIRSVLDSALIESETADILFNTAQDIYKIYLYADISDEKSAETEKDQYYSRFHYIRRFSKRLGLTPHKYHLQCRIREAQELLMNGYSSADAAAKEDFYDQSHFIKCFKTVVGITPSEYKASLRNFLQSR